MKKEAIRGRVRHRGSDKLILSKRFIAFLQEIRKEACAAKKKPAKPTLEKKVSPASNLQNPCLLASFVIRKKSRSNVRRRPLHVYEEERRPHQDEGHGASFA